MSDPDLLIRTAGEMRISNFLLWQISYAEIWITQKLWPDFRGDDLLQACCAYRRPGAEVRRPAGDEFLSRRPVSRWCPFSLDEMKGPSSRCLHALGLRDAHGRGVVGGALRRRAVRAMVPVLVRPEHRGVLAAAWELARLLGATSARPSGNSVFGGVLAIVIANWLPHLVETSAQDDGELALLYDPVRPLNILAWPFLTFIAILMASFVVQSVQFARAGPDDGQDRGDRTGHRVHRPARELHRSRCDGSRDDTRA